MITSHTYIRWVYNSQSALICSVSPFLVDSFIHEFVVYMLLILIMFLNVSGKNALWKPSEGEFFTCYQRSRGKISAAWTKTQGIFFLCRTESCINLLLIVVIYVSVWALSLYTYAIWLAAMTWFPEIVKI